MSRGCSLHEVAELGWDALAGLVPEWDALAAAAAEPNPFYESWALVPALETDGPPMRCAAVRIRGELAALFPLQPDTRYKGLPARALRSWRNRHMLLCTPLVRKGREQEAFAALIAWAARSASILELDYFPGDGPLRAALGEALGASERPWLVTYAYERALLRRAASAEAYVAGMERGVRSELRRRERRLKEAGRAEYVRLGSDLERWIEEFLVLEASGWKGQARGALACRESDVRYARAVLRGAQARGELFASGVDLDGKPIARRLCLTSGEGGILFKSAYDEAHARLAPGMLAHLENIRAFHDQPHRLQWIDSATGPDNAAANSVWKDRRRVERVAIGVDAWGAFLLTLLPLLRKAKAKMRPAPAARAARTETSSPSTGARP